MAVWTAEAIEGAFWSACLQVIFVVDVAVKELGSSLLRRRWAKRASVAQ